MTQKEALSILKTGANVFLTGEPGSGKTHTINEYVAYLRGRDISPAITASTGIAATHIGGRTIHSWSGIGIKKKLDKYDLDRIASTKQYARRISKTKILIIDEVSMLSPETLAMVDAVLREVNQSSEPFGGIQVVFSGDFFQLPPIIKEEKEKQAALIDVPRSRYAYDSSVWTKLNPVVCYLSEQYRQDDRDFLSILSAVRANCFGNNHLCLLEKRKIEKHSIPSGMTKLFSHNVDVDRVNNEMLLSLSGESRSFEMLSKGPRALVMTLKKGCLSPEVLALKIGAAVMFTKNNLKAGFVNGTLGTVLRFAKDSGYPLIRTRNGREILAEPMDFTIEEGNKILAKVTQIPLRLAFAITVHKSQGMSLDEAVMDLSGVFEFGQGYVALSRVRRLSGLHLLGWNDLAFKVHPEILARDGIFRRASEEAKAFFGKIPPVELVKMHKNFVAFNSRY